MGLGEKFTRIDTLDLKSVLYQKIGHERAERYFDLLKKLFGAKLTNNEFKICCIQAIGKENLPLHNQFIRAILKNSCLAKSPPWRVKNSEGSLTVENCFQGNNRHSVHGASFPLSPRKVRSSVHRDRKFRDRPSPLGPLGKNTNVTQEQQSATDMLSHGSRPPIEVASVEDGEEVEQGRQANESPSIQSKSPPVTAPLGITINTGGAHKTLSGGSMSKFRPSICQKTGELPDATSLMTHLEQNLEIEGVGISIDCANLLTSGLDLYLKKLIEPCVRLAGSRCGREQVPQQNCQSVGAVQRPSSSICASLTDFRVAMGSNPRILGADWAVQLEKVCCNCAFEE